MEITKGSARSNKAHQTTLEYDWINGASIGYRDSLYLVINELGQMTLVHGMYEHARGNLKQDIIFYFIHGIRSLFLIQNQFVS